MTGRKGRETDLNIKGRNGFESVYKFYIYII